MHKEAITIYLEDTWAIISPCSKKTLEIWLADYFKDQKSILNDLEIIEGEKNNCLLIRNALFGIDGGDTYYPLLY